MEVIKSFFNQIHAVEPHILEHYLSFWSAYHVPKKTVMTAPGEVEKYMYFVMEGVQKSYFFHQNKYHIVAFTYPPSFSGIPDSFFTQSPSKHYLETVSDSAFMRISYEKHQQLMQENRAIETLFRKGTEMLLAGTIQRHTELMAFDIQTRFETFMKRSAHLIHLVSQKDIASYLRIDATNFSKLLNQYRI